MDTITVIQKSNLGYLNFYNGRKGNASLTQHVIVLLLSVTITQSLELTRPAALTEPVIEPIDE